MLQQLGTMLKCELYEKLKMAQLVSETANLTRLTFPFANKRATAADEGKERAAAS